MFRDFSTFALVQYATNLVLALFLVFWTWRGCLREKEIIGGACVPSALAARFFRFRWVAVALLAGAILSVFLPSAGRSYGALTRVAVPLWIAQLVIGYGAFCIQSIRNERRSRTRIQRS
jgi:hypothetical protein